MPRPLKHRYIRGCQKRHYFKPAGVPAKMLEEVVLAPFEVEALRLKHIEEMDQTEAAKLMKVSQSTFHRVLAKAHKKVSRAIISGHAIRIDEV